MTHTNLKTTLDGLWSNWAFRLSLSSNELFHSNVLQYLAEMGAKAPPTPMTEAGMAAESGSQGPTSLEGRASEMSEPAAIDCATAIRLLDILCGGDMKQCPATREILKAGGDFEYSVQREWHHMDLAILRRKKVNPPEMNANPWFPVYALEVKIKAYPEKEQLKRYRDVLDNKSEQGHRPSLFLLAGMGKDAVEGVDCTYYLDFQSLSKGLSTLQLQANPVASEYIQLCGSLSDLFEHLKNALSAAMTWNQASEIADHLRPYRLHSLWWKLWSAFVAEECRQHIQQEAGVGHLAVYSGYTRTGNLGVCWKWPLVNPDEPVKKPMHEISIGVQIEGASVRLFLNIVHPELGPPQTAREKVEKALLTLMRSQGVFATNPEIGTLIQLENFPFQPNPCVPTASDLFVPGQVGKGRKPYLLTGYANAQGNGFADVRLTLQGASSIGQVAGMVCGVLVDDLFSTGPRAEGADSLLRRVVRGFEEACRNDQLAAWMEAPHPARIEIDGRGSPMPV